MDRITLVALDISCDHCTKAIEKAVGSLSGVRMVEADIDTKSVVVEFDPEQAPLATIEAAMKDEGYPVQK